MRTCHINFIIYFIITIAFFDANGLLKLLLSGRQQQQQQQTHTYTSCRLHCVVCKCYGDSSSLQRVDPHWTAAVGRGSADARGWLRW